MQPARDRVYWIGGSPGSGKSSATRILAQRYQAWAYYLDFHDPDHIRRALGDPGRFSAVSTFMAKTMDERWVDPRPEDMAEEVIEMWSSLFPFVVEDIRSLPPPRLVFAEGPGLFPGVVANVLASPDHAAWIVPTSEFVRAVRWERGIQGFMDTRDPDLAMEHLIARDILLAEYVERQAHELGFPVLVTDGSQSAEDLAGQVQELFFGKAGQPPARGIQPGTRHAVPTWDRYVGHYAGHEGAGCIVTYSDDVLRISSSTSGRGGALAQLSKLVFRVDDGEFLGERVTFMEDEQGRITAVSLGPGRFMRADAM